MEKGIRVNDLVALCHIINDYPKFNHDLYNVKFSSMDKLCSMVDIIKGKAIFGYKQLKKFYQENKDIIDKIERYTCMFDFIAANYIYDAKNKAYIPSDEIDSYYQYLLENKKDLDKVLSVLYRIRSLDINKVSLDHNLDMYFLDNVFTINTTFGHNLHISYFDNIEIIPNYENNVIRYKTTGSNYLITTDVGFDGPRSKKICVDSLTFDPERLPQEISKKEIFDSIINRKKEKENECKDIRTSVDLSVGIDDLIEQYTKMKKLVGDIRDYSDRKRVYEAMLNLKESISLLNIGSVKYNESLINTNPLITDKSLESEKKQYIKRREWAKFDLD